MQRLLNTKNRTLIDLIAKSHEAEQLTQLIRTFLNKDLAAHCKVIHLQKGCLTVAISSAIWATQFRYVTTDLLNKLRTEGKLYQLRNIKTIIEQSFTLQVEKVVSSHTLSTKSSDIIRQTANDIQSDVLKNALLKLAETIKK